MSERGAIGAHLGGIGAMLEAADVCPRCGEIHLDAPSVRHGRGTQHYPLGSVGNYPVYTPDIPPIVDVPRVSAGQRIRDFEALAASPSHSSTAQVVPQDPGRAGRQLMISWLPPPDLGEVF